jgi:4,5-DOPA dioxygenase extradiol
VKIAKDLDWGLDHGAWSVLVHTHSKPQVPILQLSIDYSKPASWHFEFGKALGKLREKGILIMGSGNIVHNLGMMNWEMQGGFSWAKEFDAFVKQRIVEGRFSSLVNYADVGKSARLSVPTAEHYFPMLYVLGALEEGEKIEFFNEEIALGSVGMRGFTTK